ncbi:glycosyltransferase family 39 protein [Jatrophihabitans sp. GAS493]|uniref:ArnT family glycosyltransferase n=1 Tax=Jatrophihabitans sp. GAS493 TaxID=1907575 RepID=UPI000BB7069E|nr:glycosyltransferase family 39 protein [Jatrophihabitans sp. GAS493]
MTSTRTDRELGHGPVPDVELRHRLGLAVLLVATAVLYLWRLSASRYANSFYAAAVQAGTQSWKAFFFGSLDRSNFITVDKPPASLWIMELSGRIFGFSSWSMLAPQALEGVAAVALLYAAVSRWYGRGAGLLAGAALAVTPVAVAMFRFNNPDAAMALLLVLAGYCTVRAIESASTGWLLLAGSALGFAFLAKGLQPLTLIPGIALAYLLTAQASLTRRLLQLTAALLAFLASAGWWVLIVTLWPASGRPYIGGSKDNTPLGLALGANGVGRLDGASVAGSRFSGAPGPGRLFSEQLGGQIAWLLPPAFVALLVLAWAWRHRRALPDRRPFDPAAASLLLWGGWLVVTGVVLSFMSGPSHAYYTVQLAPASCALVAAGAGELWPRRGEPLIQLVAALTLIGTGWTAWLLLGRLPNWQPELRYIALGASVAGATLMLASLMMASLGSWRTGAPVRSIVLRPQVVAAVAVVALLVAPLGLSLQTASLVQTGTNPMAGVRAASKPPGPPGRSVVDLIALLRQNRDRWVLAAITSQKVANLELDSGGLPIMAIGGFEDADATPTLKQFQSDVKRGEIGYFLDVFGPNGTAPQLNATSTAIRRWVHKYFRRMQVGTSIVYDLSQRTP